MKWIGYLLVAMMTALASLFIWYLITLARPVSLPEPVSVIIPTDSGTAGAVAALYAAGVIRSRYAFLLHVLLTNQRSQLQAGTYTFSDQVSIPTILQIITKANSLQGETQITLLEGWTNATMAKELAAHFAFSADDFLTAADTAPTTTFDFLADKPQSASLQGFLFPDTYRFFNDATPPDMITIMLNNFDQRLTQHMRDDLAAQQRSLYDTVIVASVVQQEARIPEDMNIVADIFWKRLDAGQPLQSDATINYITQKNDTTPSIIDLDVESAYNTYRNVGLPPTPICNPGLQALTAVVYPTKTNYWYFLTTPSGDMKYSETYDQHLDYKAQYYP